MNRCSESTFSRCLATLTAPLVLAGLVAITVVPAAADDQDAANLFTDFSLGQFGGEGNFALQTDEPAKVTATYVASGQSPDEIIVRVRVQLEPGWHIYSTTQPKGGPKPTKLKLVESDGVQLTGDWQSSEPPKRAVSQEFGGLTVEEHEDEIIFSATAKLVDPNQDIDQLGELKVNVNALTCLTGGACIPLNETFVATLSSEATSKQMTTAKASADPADLKANPVDPKRAFRDGDYVVRWEAINLTPNVAPGQTGTLRFTAIPDDGYHVYTSSINDEQSKTNFVVNEKSNLRVGLPSTTSPAIDYALLPGATYHRGNVTWTMPFAVPMDATKGERRIAGGIAYQACTDNSCRQPQAIQFETVVNVVDAAPASNSPSVMKLAAKKRADVLDDAATIKWVDKVSASDSLNAQSTPAKNDSLNAIAAATSTSSDLASSADESTIEEDEPASISFGSTLFFAFIGGVILNFMPCVLPVVGLKVMSFVQQAGQDRKRIFMLNMVYALGILAVFALLASLAVFFSLKWGQQFTYFPLRLGLTLLLFAMALSYLGVWEIPVPGMAAGKTSQSLQQREGYTGAFFKGVFATVLATPCSGPLLGGILGITFALTGLQKTAVIMTVGVGMALPYLMIGLWPALVAWLPKPGTWMETLKEFMAFLFLGTVAFFFNQFSEADKVPVFVALIGVWFGCWIIGKVPNWSSLSSRLYAWSGGIASAAVIGFAAFYYLGPAPESTDDVKQIAWQPYDEVKLQQLQAEGRTVMVDFTAKWCFNCIVNYNVALNTEPTRQLIEELDAVPMLADWTDENEAIEAKLEELKSQSIPILAIYPGKSPGKPIVLRDLVSQSMVLAALREAGPSVGAGSKAKTDSESVASRMTPDVPVATR